MIVLIVLIARIQNPAYEAVHAALTLQNRVRAAFFYACPFCTYDGADLTRVDRAGQSTDRAYFACNIGQKIIPLR